MWTMFRDTIDDLRSNALEALSSLLYRPRLYIVLTFLSSSLLSICRFEMHTQAFCPHSEHVRSYLACKPSRHIFLVHNEF